jgi:hypothetical protein
LHLRLTHVCTDGWTLGTELDPLLVQYALAEFRRFSAFCNTTLHFCLSIEDTNTVAVSTDVRVFEANFFCPPVRVCYVFLIHIFVFYYVGDERLFAFFSLGIFRNFLVVRYLFLCERVQCVLLDAPFLIRRILSLLKATWFPILSTYSKGASYFRPKTN